MNIRLMPGRRVRINGGKRLDGSPSLATVVNYSHSNEHGDWYVLKWDAAPDLTPQPCCRNIFTPLRTAGRNPRPLMERGAAA